MRCASCVWRETFTRLVKGAEVVKVGGFLRVGWSRGATLQPVEGVSCMFVRQFRNAPVRLDADLAR